MTLDATSLTALLTVLAGGAGGGGLITYLLPLRQRRRQMDAAAADTRATADSRIMGAVAGIVEQASAHVPSLIERITRLEGDRDRLARDLDRLRDEQDVERAELAEWRSWGARQRTWSAQAVDAIRSLGGQIPDPPTPPRSVATTA